MTKIKVEHELCGFSVPERLSSATQSGVSFHLIDLSDDTLEGLIGEFRQEVYATAGREAPTSTNEQRVKTEMMLVDSYLQGKRDRKKAGSTALLEAAANYARVTMKAHNF